ncbi:PHD and RING finger domain-containing protein 1 isoform X1 [Hippoglossus stenolepis]|uniref:PHD and RING finger domain-containing protein 1 isoform X1 n=1 Tax=Hippoglossus stenolepis TaxID=195615 RepID=UPI001FAFCEDA|nr:PHD and RING finger domain-containing protein 1 isoform X1 [Hippoglossus stenolepis]XP_035012230.2 PHD and RING finger domain-containing protein 1 isoform X1 [Hippoglossus stenolepis]
MDEDDNQDELINQNASSSKGRRAALWAISDDSDDDEEESEEGESDSGEEENHPDGEDDEDEEEEEEEDGNEEEGDEEDEDIKAEDGALGGTGVDLAEMSSDEDSDKCPICLNSFHSQPVATPESCEHYFCLDCILEWTKNANSCPVDRLTFNNIYLRKCYGGKVKKIITVQKPVKEGLEETVDVDLEQTNCEVCGGSDREDRLLLCDGCDAGYHMECLTPPLDSVPVEEWFCPECEASNRHTRDSVVEVSDTESLPSTARPATSRHQHRAPGPTRAIARTQQSERVRASVNRFRITQARTSQLAPTYLIQSTWLDDTINAVVAGLNTAVYIRDLTPRVPPTHRRRTVKRRRVGSKRTSSAKGKGATTGFRRRKRRGRRSRKVGKKTATPRSRIANNLGIVKNKKGTALPTVYQPSEHTLSNMRADIGAASLSIYGDPFGLDPFTEREEEEQQQQHAHVSSLLEAKRRGISRSALRSHQPVARPISASLSRRGVDVPQSGGVVEAAPVPDLLGSILTGQSMLLMDSSDVVIRRDGSLKATKPMMPSTVKPGSSNSSSSGDATINPEMSPIQGDSSPSPHFNGHLPGSSHSSINRPLSTSSVRSPPCTPHSAIHTQPPPYSDLPPRGHPGLQPPRSNRHNPSPGHRGTNEVRASRETSSSSIHTAPGSNFKGTIPSQSQPKKAAAKPTWVDVSVLPRIPKIKRESSGETNDGSSQAGSNRISSTNGSSSSNGYGMPETGMNSLAGDKSRKQSVDKQKGRVDGQGQRHRSDGAGSSSAFSNSFSSSSSSTGSPASQSRNPSASSSSSSVSFRINASGNSWQSRRLSVTSPSTSGGSVKEHRREKEDEAKRRQLRRDKQMLLASHTLVNDEQDSTNIYDPFNPTLSDASSSDSEAESSSQDKSSLHATHEFKAPSLRRKEDVMQNKQDRVRVKTEEEETEVSQGELRRANALETISQEAGCSQEYVKVEKESRLVDIKVEKQTSLLDTIVKREPGLDDEEEAERSPNVTMDLNSDTADITVPAHHSLDLLKTEKETVKEESVESEGSQRGAFPNCRKDSSASSSAPTKKKQTESKSVSTSCSKSPSRDLGHKRKTSKAPKESQSSSSETDKGRRGDHHASGQGGRQKEKEKDRERSSRRSRSRERRRARSTSQSSQSTSPDKSSRKKRRSRSHSKERKRSRSVSSSSSRERSRRKKQKSKGKILDIEGDHKRGHMAKDKRPGRSRSKSRSRSRSLSRLKDDRRGVSRSKSRSKSRSRSRERRKDPTRQQQPSQSSRDKVGSRSKDKRRHRSRSSSKERMTEEGSSSKERKKEEGSSSKSSQKNMGSSVSSSKDKKQIQDKKKEKDVIHNSLKEEKKTKRSKQEFPSSISTSKVKKEVIDLREDNEAPTAEMTKEVMVVKEIKKEKRTSLDMFEDAPLTKSIKTEEIDSWSLPEAKDIKKEGMEEDLSQTQMCGIKTETCEITIKSEPSSPKVCHLTSFSTLTAPVTEDTPQDAASPGLMTSEEQPNAAGLTLSVKQEVLQPSDSDDDFNVDVMLDNLDYVKSECTEGGDGFVKQEKEDEEGKKEGEQVSAVVGAKSKAPVKRVTWNIQEPEGPQPEKSASKVALYKLKLKQEGARRPSSTAQTSSQDITGESSKKGAGARLGTSSRSDGLNPEGLSETGQGDEEEGDVSRKDKYLKKLHMQERAIEEVKLAIKPFYQNRDINKDEYKDILRKAVQKVCHSKSGEINPVKVGNLVKAYVDKYKHARKHSKGEDLGQEPQICDSP